MAMTLISVLPDADERRLGFDVAVAPWGERAVGWCLEAMGECLVLGPSRSRISWRCRARCSGKNLADFFMTLGKSLLLLSVRFDPARQMIFHHFERLLIGWMELGQTFQNLGLQCEGHLS